MKRLYVLSFLLLCQCTNKNVPKITSKHYYVYEMFKNKSLFRTVKNGDILLEINGETNEKIKIWYEYNKGKYKTSNVNKKLNEQEIKLEQFVNEQVPILDNMNVRSLNSQFSIYGINVKFYNWDNSIILYVRDENKLLNQWKVYVHSAIKIQNSWYYFEEEYNK